MISPAEQRTLAAICDTLVNLPGSSGRNASGQPKTHPNVEELERAAEQALDGLDPPALAQFRLWLRAVEHPASMGIACGVAKSFSGLTHSRREKALRALA